VTPRPKITPLAPKRFKLQLTMRQSLHDKLRYAQELLSHRVPTGDIVEIITQANHNPSRDWLSFVKAARARQKIKHWLNIHQRERAIEIGRKLMEREAKKYRINLKSISDKDYDRVSSDYGVARSDDLMAGIGFGRFSARQVLGKLVPVKEDQQSATAAAPPAPQSGIGSVVRRVFGGSTEGAAITVRGHDDLLVYRARCCSPIRGEEIVGYVTRGKGVAVHSRHCPNVTNLLYEADRRIAVEWGKLEKVKTPGVATYPVKLNVFCDDRAGMLKQITAVISDDSTNIRNLGSRTADSQATIDVVIDIEDVKHLDRILRGLKKIPGVRDVQRVQKI